MSLLTFTDALTEITAVLQAQHPVLANVLSRAHALVHDGHVFLEEDGHSAMVRSSTDAARWYAVNGSCACDASHFEKVQPCKHRFAVRLYEKVSARLAEDVATAPVVTAQTEPSPVEPAQGIDPRFVTFLHGKPFVRYAGLLAMATERGLVSLGAEFISVSADLALAKAVAIFQDGRRFTEAADSTPANVPLHIKPHYPRMALTRAKARCLRDALNISITALEEVEGE